MLRRLILLTVLAALHAGAVSARAQGNPYSGEPGRFEPWNGNGMWEPYGGYPAMSTPYGSSFSPYSEELPLRAPGTPIPPNVGVLPRHTQEYLPEGDIRGPFYSTGRIENLVGEAVRRSWVRLEYLNWSLSDYDDQVLGAPYANADVTDPVNGPNVIPARDRDGTIRLDPAGTLFVVAQAQDLGRLLPDDRNGGRLSFGIPTRSGEGEFEANFWTMTDYKDSFYVQPRVAQGLFLVLPAIPLTLNGQIIDPTVATNTPQILFDDFMAVATDMELNGTEFVYRHRPVRHESPVDVQFLGGFKYIHLQESIQITGNDNNQLVSPAILGQSNDQVFGPTVGAQIEWNSKWCTFGIEERFTFGFDRHQNQVATANLFQQNQVGVISRDAGTEFAPVNQVAAYGSFHLTDRLSVRVGYELLSIFGVSRAHENFVWDDSGTVNGPTQIGVDGENRSTFNAHGFTIAAELELF
jgi:hypothetical protein